MKIAAQDLHKTFSARRQPVQAVVGLSLQVEAGEIYGLVGPDGAGKTTALRLLCGALRADAGLAMINGVDVHKEPERARQNLGYLAQRFSLYEDLTVMENLRFFAEVRGLRDKDWRPRCQEILEFVSLQEFESRLAGKLSGGMKQKLGLAAALVHRPEVLLLDEPTTGVDPVTRQDFWQLIIRLAQETGISVLVTTPYMDEAARCSRIGFMQAGRLLVEGKPADIVTNFPGEIVEAVGTPLPALRSLALTQTGVETAQLFGDKLHLRLQSGQAAPFCEGFGRVARAAGLQIERCRPVPAQLEDVFIALLEAKEWPVQ